MFITELEEEEKIGRTYRINTLAGVISPTIEGNGNVRVDMGEPFLRASDIPTSLPEKEGKVINQSLSVKGKNYLVSCVNMGNPHCLVFVDNVATIDLNSIGPAFETHAVFVQKVVKHNYLKMRVWERGAGMTLACGTGACATVVAGVLNNRCDRSTTVELPGGCLEIEWSKKDNHVYMTGPATNVFRGELN